MLPPLPFVKLPRKQYIKGPVTIGGEKKSRLDRKTIKKMVYDSDDSEDEESIKPPAEEDEEDLSSSSEEDEGYDIMKQVADLLPGDLVDGKKPTKEANTAHLQELKRPPPKPLVTFTYLRAATHFIQTWRAKERERRKHHILREYEEQVKKFDEHQKKLREEELFQAEKEVKLEAHRRVKRIEKNSQKKQSKKETTLHFTRDLTQRIKEANQLEYFTKHFPGWAIEGMKGREAEAAADRQVALERQTARQLEEEQLKKMTLLQADAALLQEDKAISQQIETMMVRYGMIHYEVRDKATLREDEQVQNIFAQHKAHLQRQQRAAAEEEAAAAAAEEDMESISSYGDEEEADYDEEDEEGEEGSQQRRRKKKNSRSNKDSHRLHLKLNPRIDLPQLSREYRRQQRSQRGNAVISKRNAKKLQNPFTINLLEEETAEVLTVKAEHIQEVGALSFAAELAQGAVPNLEILLLKDCAIRDSGWAKIIQGLRIANIFTLIQLDLRGNYLTAVSIDYFRDLAPTGIFQNLELWHLGENELHDAGIDALVRIIIAGYLINLHGLFLSNNSITNLGFSKLMKVMINLQEREMPKLTRLALENNLITPEEKRMFFPLPAYVSA